MLGISLLKHEAVATPLNWNLHVLAKKQLLLKKWKKSIKMFLFQYVSHVIKKKMHVYVFTRNE